MGPHEVGFAGRVYEIISNQLGVDINQITEESFLAEDLGASCGDTIELLRLIKKEFGVEISGKDAERISTVGEVIMDITNLLEKKGGEK